MCELTRFRTWSPLFELLLVTRLLAVDSEPLTGAAHGGHGSPDRAGKTRPKGRHARSECHKKGAVNMSRQDEKGTGNNSPLQSVERAKPGAAGTAGKRGRRRSGLARGSGHGSPDCAGTTRQTTTLLAASGSRQNSRAGTARRRTGDGSGKPAAGAGNARRRRGLANWTWAKLASGGSGQSSPGQHSPAGPGAGDARRKGASERHNLPT